jgi:hypothetical protein
MSDRKELAQSLRIWAATFRDTPVMGRCMTEAADLIEEQAAEIERLRAGTGRDAADRRNLDVSSRGNCGGYDG